MTFLSFSPCSFDLASGETLYHDIKLTLDSGINGLIGRNGAGKSTLIKLLSGSMTPQSGEVWYANGVSLGYFAQHQLDR